jgi:serine/threonine protein kinase
VLLCVRSESWKISDFGFTFEATSNQAHSSANARGTKGYRAPELVQETSVFSWETDIFSTGCVLYELLLGSPPFQSDYDVVQLAVTHQWVEAFRVDLELDTWMQYYPALFINAMLRKNWWERPSTGDILHGIESLSAKSTKIYRPYSLQLPICNDHTEDDSVVLSHDSKLWQGVQWHLYW